MRKLTSKTALILFVAIFLPLTAVFSSRANAGKIFELEVNPFRWLANNMDNWTNNLMYAVAVDTPNQLIVGCPFNDMIAGGKAKVSDCMAGKSGAITAVPNVDTDLPDNSTIPPAGGSISPSLLGLSTGLFTNIATQTDAYPVNLALYWNGIKKDSLIAPKSAYAGVGTPLLEATALGLWQSMRNIAYLFFFIALVIIGFMVMFRYKINPQTTMTVQAALPKIVIVLLLVTFSYPIGALAIDLMVTLSRIVFMVKLLPVNLGASIVTQAVTLAEAFSPAGMLTGQALLIGVLIIGLILGLLLTIIAVLISIVTRIARIIAMTIFAPLQLTLGILPGKEDSITGWFKSLVANMLAIPAMLLMVQIGLNIGLMNGTAASNAAGTIFGPFSITAVISQFIGYILSVWFIWNARKAPSFIEGALGVGGGWVPGQKPKPAGGKK